MVFARYLFLTIVFESYFRHHQAYNFIVYCFVGKTLLLTNVLCDVISCFPHRSDGSTTQQTRNKSHSKNTTRTKTFDKQHQHHDEHTATQNKDIMIHTRLKKNDQNDHHNRHNTE